MNDLLLEVDIYWVALEDIKGRILHCKINVYDQKYMNNL